jgi:hypothetical protein
LIGLQKLEEGFTLLVQLPKSNTKKPNATLSYKLQLVRRSYERCLISWTRAGRR